MASQAHSEDLDLILPLIALQIQQMQHILVNIMPSIDLFISGRSSYRSRRQIRLYRRIQRILRGFGNVPHMATLAWQSASPLPPSFWIFPGRGQWFHTVVLPLWDQKMWLQNFRLSKETLFEIAESLRPLLQKENTVMRFSVSVEERTAIGVFFLSSRICYRELAHLFGKGTSTIGEIVVEFCLAMEQTLLYSEVSMKNYNQAMAGFQRLGFPHCIGAVDGSHIPILCPKMQGAQYFNRKSYHSIVLQGACDADGVFFSAFIGYAGVTHDAHILRCSPLYADMEEGRMIPNNPQINLGGVSIPPLILGDGAYPLCRWLMKPYAVPNTDIERHYNKIFNKSRNVIERAFGRLKSRFRRLTARIELHQQNIISVVASAVILHNICERKKHHLPEDVPATNNEDVTNHDTDNDDNIHNNTIRQQGENVRRAVAEYMFRTQNS